MALSALKTIIRPARCSQLNPIFSRLYSLYEPDYLEAMKPKFPLCPTLNVQITGYDYPILEKFQGFIHKLAENMDMDVENSWAMPPKELNINRYKPKSDILEAQYHLNLSERNVQLANVSAISLPILVRILEASLPTGVHLIVENYDPEKELRRYLPDKEMLDLKAELQEVNDQ